MTRGRGTALTRMRHWTLLALFGTVVSVAPLCAQSATDSARDNHPSASRRGGEAPTLQRIVDLHVQGIPLEQALRELQFGGVPLVYSSDLIEPIRSVSCICEAIPLRDALSRLTSNTRLRFRELESGAVVLFEAGTEDPATVIVGRVEDAESGTLLRGASVRVSGKDRPVETDEQGRFVLSDLPPGEYRIGVEMLGYRTESRRIVVGADARLSLRFVLQVEPVTISPLNVSVTAGTLVAAEQRSVGHSIAVIDARSIRRSGAHDLPTVLRGQTPGVASALYGGVLGAGSEVRIRGVGSILNSQAPLVYIDGVAVDQGTNPLATDSRSGLVESATSAHRRLAEIRLEDVERIEIVKGPAATTLYGTGAANGVIHIFTRRGVEGRPRVVATTEQGVSTLRGTRSFLNDSPRSDLVERDLLRTGRHQGISASLSGGAPDVSYHFGLTHQEAAGVLAQNSEVYTGLRFGTHVVPHRALTLQLSGTMLQRRLGTRNHSGLFELADVLATESAFHRPASWEHAVREGIRGEIDVSRFYGAATLDFQASDLFRARLTVGGDTSNETNDNIGYLNPSDGIRRDYYQANHRRASVSAFGSLAYPRAGALVSTLTFGVDGYRDREATLQASVRQLPHLDAKSFSLGVGGRPNSAGSTVINGGAFVQQLLGLHDRLFVTVGLRADGNSSFGENYGVRLNPRIASAFLLGAGDAWQSKLRLAWGQSSMAPDPFAKQTRFRHASSLFTDSLVQTFDSPGNPDLRPEVASEFEIGFDQYLRGDRAAVELTYFRQVSRDAILRGSPLPITGFNRGALINLARLRSQGLEAAGRVTLYETRIAELSLGLVLTHLIENGVVTSLGEYSTIDERNSTTWHPAVNTPVGGSTMELVFRSAEVPRSAGPTSWNVVAGSRVPTTYGGSSISLRVRERLQIGGHFTFALGGFGWDNVQMTRDLHAGRISSNASFDPEVALERYVFSTDHLRLDAVRFEYALPQRLLPWRGDEGRVWVQATNAYTLDRFRRGDVTTVNPASRGIGDLLGPAGTLDYNLPVPRSVRLGLQLAF
jgi:TonB-dependent starch-binding outer membrane protein SusC